MQQNRTKNFVRIALMAAVLCLLCPVSLPIGPVPLTLGTFAVCLCGGILGPWKAAAAVGIYLILGAIGLPVFSGWTGGFSRILDMTGGFLIGYLPCAVFAGYALNKCQAVRVIRILLVLMSILFCHIPGVLWYSAIAKISIISAAAAVSLPFLVPECIKALAAAEVVRLTNDRLSK